MADEAGYLLVRGDSRRLPLADGSVHVCITSPPYWGLRDYGISGQIGLERTPDAYVASMVEVFREVRRILRDDGTCWLNLGDSYAATGKSGGGAQGERWEANGAQTVGPRGGKWSPAPPGLKPKDLVGIPWRVALALQADGWYLRSAMPWVKRSAMPESVTDRPASSLEYVFLLTKSPRYFYDPEAVRRASSPATVGRDAYTRVTGGKDGPYAVRHDHETPSHAGGRHWRNSDLWFDSVGMLLGEDGEGLGFDVTTESFAGAHFATMPTRLVEPCVLAGTSERGVCPACGAPWVRVVERTPSTEGRKNWAGCSASKNGASRNGGFYDAASSTLGFSPSCACPSAPPVPATVFDPFVGSGTTLLTACRLGRRGIGVDLSAAYLGIASRRIPDGLRPRSKLDPAAPARPLSGQMSFLDSLTPKEAPVE